MAGVFAQGAVLTVGSIIANVVSVTGPKARMDTIDVTTHDSPGGVREFVGGSIDEGEYGVSGNLTSATQISSLKALMRNRTITEGATFVLPTSPVTTLTFDCLVTSLDVGAPHDGKLEFSATFKVTGKNGGITP